MFLFALYLRLIALYLRLIALYLRTPIRQSLYRLSLSTNECNDDR